MAIRLEFFAGRFEGAAARRILMAEGASFAGLLREAGVALAMWDKVKDIAPAISIAAAPPQTKTRAFFACTCISIFSIADRVEITTARDRHSLCECDFINTQQ